MLTIPSEIKDLLHEDSCKKNIRIHFPNGERTDVCNDLIVKDSVSFTESLCSQDQLKFGLCESPVFECEVVGVGNIKGATIEVSCEIYCSASVTGAEWRTDLQHYIYAIPYGTFIVSDCKRQADMNHRRIQAYGGNSLINTDNAASVLKNTKSYDKSDAYQPLVFSTMMMLSGSTGQIGLPLSEFTRAVASPRMLISQIVEYPISGESHFSGVPFEIPSDWGEGDPSWSRAARLEVLGECYLITNLDMLYYVDAPNPTVTRSEILSSLCVPSNSLKDIFDVGATIVMGQDPNPPYVWTLSNIYSHVKGKYLYPYQAVNSKNGQYTWPMVVFIPTSVRIRWKKSGIEVTRKSITFRPTLQSKLYSVDTSSMPQYRLYRERIAITETHYSPNTEPSTFTYTYYTYDDSDIDYVKIFGNELELAGLFGTLRRDNSFGMLNIKQQFGLNPSGTLYPGSSVYPEGVTGGKLLPHDYQSCWYDDEYTQLFGAIICEYKNTNNVECSYTLYISGITEEVDPSNYKTYDLSDNDIINGSLWTQAQIETICNAIASNIAGVTYMPVEFVGRGLPYVEAGDTFEILTASRDSITTIVLNRTLSGEQVLTDSYKSV